MTNRQNAHLTYKGNVGVGRHGWLRLTPAYSVKLVRDKVNEFDPGIVITDPFSGTGTTPLAAAEHGAFGQSLDVNPFLIWLGNTKVSHYGDDSITAAESALAAVLADAKSVMGDETLWQPPLHKIERWWSHSALAALKAIRAGIDAVTEGPARDLLDIAFCKTLIACSNAAFNHQSMSFKDVADDALVRLFEVEEADAVISMYRLETLRIIESAALDLPGAGQVYEGDSRAMEVDLKQCDLLLTSPPYVNRMSYIRELRPYMYWMRLLDQPSMAGDLDWLAIGGTWGSATTKLNTWTSNVETPMHADIEAVCAKISADGGKNGPLLANYVRRYFVDMWAHMQSAARHVQTGGTASYIVGNSTFYGHVVPAEQWYAVMMREAGFGQVKVTNIRKRNSKKELFEFDVSGIK